MSSIRVGDGELEYYSAGGGEPLVLIMGFAGSARAWGDTFVEGLARDFRVITFSNRGCGLSTDPGGELTCRLMADDTTRLIEKLGLESAHVFGISMGGRIAQDLAIEYPRRVRKVVLASTGCGVRGVPPSPEIAQTMLQVASRGDVDAARAFVRTCVSAEFSSKHGEFLDEIARITRLERDVAERQLRAVRSFDSYDRLSRLRAETLIMQGTEDRINSPHNAEILLERIPNAKLVEIEGAGHVFVWERPEEAARIVSNFLRLGGKDSLQLIKGSRTTG
jgi:pimeloyl-ACP methyl ester carboxylesterase